MPCRSFVVFEFAAAQVTLSLLTRIVPFAPKATTWPDPFPCTPKSAFAVDDVRGVQVTASGLVTIVPASPTATNRPLRNWTALRSTVTPEFAGVHVDPSLVQNTAPLAPTSTSSALPAVFEVVNVAASNRFVPSGGSIVHVPPASRGTTMTAGLPEPPAPLLSCALTVIE